MAYRAKHSSSVFACPVLVSAVSYRHMVGCLGDGLCIIRSGLCLLWLVSVLTGAIPVLVCAAEEELAQARRLAEAGRSEEALERIEAFLVRHPGDPEGRFQKGLILVQLNRPEQAIDVYLALIRDHPELPEPYNNLAVLYASQGQYEKARDALRTAISTHPSYATAYENLGDIYANMASAAYRQALQLNQENTALQAKLTLIGDLASIRPRPAALPATTVAEKASPAPPPPSAPAAKPGKMPTVAEKASPAPPPPSAPAAKPGSPPTAAEKASPAPPTSTPATKPAKTPTPEETQRVLATVTAWARAWAVQDVDAYLGFYARDFSPPQGLSRAAWEAQRRHRLTQAGALTVTVDEPRVTFRDSTNAQVTFWQTYRSEGYSDRVQKTLKLRKQDEQWQILAETASPAPPPPSAPAAKPESPPTVAATTSPAPPPPSAPAAKPESPPTVATMTSPAPPPPSAPATKSGSPPTAEETQRVLATVTAWARAWAVQDVDAYLRFYAPDFSPPQGLSRAAWEAQRRQRLTQAGALTVTVDEPRVTFRDSTHARVTFWQTYRSERYSTRVQKTLDLHKQGEQWQIQQERVIH